MTDAPSGPLSDAVGASEPDAAAPEAGVGEVLSPASERYERRQLVGVGGMGRVTVVYDRTLRREVALKEPSPGHEAPLLDEARRAAALEHPGIVPVLDAGVDATGRAWYTMRLLRGRPLEEVLRAERDLAGRLRHVRTLLGVAEAIAYAHARGVVHRDITPANILLGDLGDVCVADWGLAAAHGSRGGGGTPGYRAPEQHAGAPADARADVYALGAVLFRLCAGAAPPNVDAPGASQDATPPRAAAKMPAETPRELTAIVARATAQRPEDRYEDARAFAQDLAAWLDGRTVSAHDYSRWELTRRFLQAHRNALTVGGVALLALLFTTTTQYLATVRERDRALAAEATARHHYALALSSQSVEAFRTGRLADAAVLAAHAYAGARGASAPSDAIGAARALGVLAGVDASQAIESVGQHPLPPSCGDARLHAEGVVCLRTDATTDHDDSGAARTTWGGRWIAAAPSAHGLVLLGADGSVTVGERRLALPPNVRPTSLTVAGGYLAVRDGPALHTVSLADGAVVSGTDPCARGERVLAAVPDATGRLAVACSSRELYVGPPNDLERSPARLPHTSALTWLDEDLLVGTITGEVVRLRLDGTEVWSASIDSAAVLDLGAHDRALVWARTPRSTTLLDRGSGALRTVLPGLRAPPVTTDRGVLRGVTPDGQVHAWRMPARWPAHRLSLPSGLSTVAVSPDGTTVVLGGLATRVARWRVDDGSVQWDTLVDGIVKGFAWTRSGLLATVSGANVTFLLRPGTTTVGGPVLDPRRPTAYRRLGALPDDRLIGLRYGDSPVLWDDAHARVDELDEVPEGHDLGVGPEDAAMVDRTGGVWVLARGARRARQLGSVTGALAVDAGPDGRTLVATVDRLVVVGPSGARERTIPLDGRTVTDVAWSLDGALLATGNLDGTADLWRAQDGEHLASLVGHADRVAALEFAPDGSWLVTASWDHSARRWSLAPLRAPPTPASVEARWGTTLEAALAAPARGTEVTAP